MKTIDLRQFEDCVVLHFETEGKRINAYTLASTLVSLADAAKAANDTVNHGYDVEIVVEALGPGSFRAKLRAVYRQRHNLFSKEVGLALVIGVLVNYIYERTLAVRSVGAGGVVGAEGVGPLDATLYTGTLEQPIECERELAGNFRPTPDLGRKRNRAGHPRENDQRACLDASAFSFQMLAIM